MICRVTTATEDACAVSRRTRATIRRPRRQLDPARSPQLASHNSGGSRNGASADADSLGDDYLIIEKGVPTPLKL